MSPQLSLLSQIGLDAFLRLVQIPSPRMQARPGKFAIMDGSIAISALKRYVVSF
jgi:hypothetical protein